MARSRTRRPGSVAHRRGSCRIRCPDSDTGSASCGVACPRGGLRNPVPGGLSPLLYAARDGRLDIARTLVEAGADINQADANGISPLIAAITNNHVAVALFLIDRGADIHASDWYGRTPLWSAVETRNQDFDAGTQENSIDRAPFLELIKVLIERGANVDVRTKEIPPFKRHFLKGTGSLSWVDFTGQTPFLTAALAGDVTVMRLLLAHGADPHITTVAGTTALMAAAGINWVFYQTYDEGPEKLLEAVELCYSLGNGRECGQLDGADGGPRRRQPGVGRHHPVPGREGRKARRQGQGRSHAVDVGRGRLPRYTSVEAQAELDRVDRDLEREIIHARCRLPEDWDRESTSCTRTIDDGPRSQVRVLRNILAVVVGIGFVSFPTNAVQGQAANNGAISGVVQGPQGPEAGVWVIAETNELPTKMIKIVVTDDQGRFVLPELPTASYSVWVRGYGLVDSKPVTLKPDATGVKLNATAARTPQEAAKVYPGNYWLSLLEAAGEDRVSRAPAPRATVSGRHAHPEQLGVQLKSGCNFCHQLGNAADAQRGPRLTRRSPSVKAHQGGVGLAARNRCARERHVRDG